MAGREFDYRLDLLPDQSPFFPGHSTRAILALKPCTFPSWLVRNNQAGNYARLGLSMSKRLDPLVSEQKELRDGEAALGRASMTEYAQVSSSYEALADEYVAHIYHELEHKPLDREWLARFAAAVGIPNPICDLGCGPGHLARYLHEHGEQVLGMDLSPRMIERARQLNSGIEIRVGNMAALLVDDGSW